MLLLMHMTTFYSSLRFGLRVGESEGSLVGGGDGNTGLSVGLADGERVGLLLGERVGFLEGP